MTEPRQYFADEYAPLLEALVRTLVDDPAHVKVRVKHGEQTTVFEVDVPHRDRGKVIGKQGRTAQALRTLLSAAATKYQVRAVMDIVE